MYLATKLVFLSQNDEDWILDYLSSGKGVIPYQMITNFDSLNIEPENGEFFKLEDFYSTLKERDIDQEKYENVKKFFSLLKLKTLGDLNKIYNFQDTLILCEIFEQRAGRLQELFKYNFRKCNSASGFSGCVHCLKSKCSIALPTDAKIIRVFETTLIGGYSSVNTRMAFDLDILEKDPKTEKVLVEITDRQGVQKQLKRFSSKIIKMDEINQYGQAMTKPLPYGCIKKQKKVPNLTEFNEPLQSITLDDPVGHLFTVDIEFFYINKKNLLYNEIYLPIFEKDKKVDKYERSTVQIMIRAQKKTKKAKS